MLGAASSRQLKQHHALDRVSLGTLRAQAQRLQQLQQQGQWPGSAIVGGGAAQTGYLSQQQQQQQRLSTGATAGEGPAAGPWGGAQSQLPPSAFTAPGRPQGAGPTAAGMAAEGDR